MYITNVFDISYDKQLFMGFLVDEGGCTTNCNKEMERDKKKNEKRQGKILVQKNEENKQEDRQKEAYINI